MRVIGYGTKGGNWELVSVLKSLSIREKSYFFLELCYFIGGSTSVLRKGRVSRVTMFLWL